MDRPLGDYDPLSDWTGKPRSWGPEGRWRAWFAGDVIKGLVTVLDEHISAVQSKYPDSNSPIKPAAIGCVPWLTNPEVVDRLLNLSACCIVIDKGRFQVPSKLLRRADLGFPNVLPGLRDRMPAVDGTPLLVGPSTPREATEYALGPVRVAGYRRKRKTPLVHAKLLVLGEIILGEIGPEEGPTMEESWFEPRSVWWGSANWTKRAPTHLEVGFWSDDPALVEVAADFMGDLLAFSEPAEAVTESPESNLVPIEYDEEAMREAAQELYYAAVEEDAAEQEE